MIGRHIQISKLFKGCLLTLVCLSSSVTYAETDSQKEYVAAFSYRILQFVDFPVASERSRICFAGLDSVDIANVMKAQLKLKKQNTFIDVISKAAVEQLSPKQCHIVYVAPLTIIDKPVIAELAKDSLVIGNSDDFESFGNTAAILFEDNRPQISISKQQLKRSTYKVRARLLNAVTLVP